MALTAKLKQLADELTHQYRVTYARPQSLIPPERVTVAGGEARAHRARHAGQGRAAGTPVIAVDGRALVGARRLHRSSPRPRSSPAAAPRRQTRRPRRRRRSAALPRRRRPRLAERHRHRRHRHATSPTSTAEDFHVFEDGVKQDVTFFNRTQPADRAGAAARHQRQHGHASCRPRRKRPSASPSGCGRRTSPRSSTSTAASSSCRRSRTTSPSSSRRSGRRRPAARRRCTTRSTSR